MGNLKSSVYRIEKTSGLLNSSLGILPLRVLNVFLKCRTFSTYSIDGIENILWILKLIVGIFGEDTLRNFEGKIVI